MSEHDPDPSPGLDADTLAAFIDGRLGPEDRARVMERLAASDDDYEPYLDALHALRELDADAAPAGGEAGPDEADAPVVPDIPRARHPGRGTPFPGWWVLAAAAALVAVVLAPWLVDRATRAPGYTPGVLVASLEPGARTAGTAQDVPWRVLRSPDALLTPSERAFRLGVHHVRLESAAVTGDHAAVARLAGDMEVLAAGLPGGSAFAALYRELAALPADHPEAVRLRRQAWDALADTAPAADARLGAWAAASRQAVATGDLAWPRGAVARDARAAVDAGALSPELRAAWEAALGLLEREAPAADAGRLIEALDAVLRAGGG